MLVFFSFVCSLLFFLCIFALLLVGARVFFSSLPLSSNSFIYLARLHLWRAVLFFLTPFNMKCCVCRSFFLYINSIHLWMCLTCRQIFVNLISCKLKLFNFLPRMPSSVGVLFALGQRWTCGYRYIPWICVYVYYAPQLFFVHSHSWWAVCSVFVCVCLLLS